MAEHCRIQFNTIFNSKKQVDNPLIKELMQWCTELSKANFAPDCSGNLSFRTKQGFIITTYMTDFSRISNENFAEVLAVDAGKNQVIANGNKEPSSETFMHYAIYSQRNDVNAIFHAHSDEFLRNNDKLNLPETKEEKPAGSIELAQEVQSILGNNNFILLKNHGFIALGDTIGSVGNLVMKRYNQLIRIIPKT